MNRTLAGPRPAQRQRRRSEPVDLGDQAAGFDAPVEVLVPHQGGPHQGRTDPLSTDDRGRRQPAEGSGPWAADRADPAGTTDDDPYPDEPAAQHVAPADAARVARMADDVLVVDGRPRYHLAGCLHLRDRETEPLPVGEAVELGFTPCAACEPDTRAARRRPPRLSTAHSARPMERPRPARTTR